MSVEGYPAYLGQFAGLSETEVEARRKEYGLNALPLGSVRLVLPYFYRSSRTPPLFT